jgi:hypothetical protein
MKKSSCFLSICLLLLICIIQFSFCLKRAYIPPPTVDLVQDPRNLSVAPVYQLNSSFFLLGGLFSLTSAITGDSLSPGIQRLEAFRCTIAELNLDKNILNKTTIVYNAVDTQNTPIEALSAGLSFLQRNMTNVIGKFQ